MKSSIFRRVLAPLVALAVAATLPAAAQPAPYVIPVVLSLTGPAANLGQDELAGLTAFEKFINRTGGIKGQPLHFQVGDDQSQPAVAVQLMQQIMQSHPTVVLGSSIAAQSQAMAALVTKDGPVLYALTPNMNPAPGGMVFATSAPTVDLSGVGVTYYRLRKMTKIGVFVTTDASGQNNLESLQSALKKPENKDVKIVDIETFGITDVSANAQAVKMKGAGAQMIYALPNGTAFGTALHALADAGIDVPVYTSAANFSPVLLDRFKTFLPKELTCSGASFFNRDRPASDPQKKPIDDFYASLALDGITAPTVSHAFAWDPAFIVVSIMRQLGTNITPVQLHDAIEKLRKFPGVGGIYDFSSGNQHGAGEDGLLVLRSDPNQPGKIIIVSKQGGVPL
jgi:branched-chain amino acid transport system substrate-binding protein